MYVLYLGVSICPHAYRTYMQDWSPPADGWTHGLHQILGALGPDPRAPATQCVRPVCRLSVFEVADDALRLAHPCCCSDQPSQPPSEAGPSWSSAWGHYHSMYVLKGLIAEFDNLQCLGILCHCVLSHTLSSCCMYYALR